MGIAERKMREKQARIKQIRKSAAYFFEKKGFQKVTMDDIAHRAEISKKTIYLYFKSKEDLYYDVVREAMARTKSIVIDGYESRKAPEENIRLIFEDLYRWYIDNHDATNIFVRLRENEITQLLSQDNLDHLRDLMRSTLKHLGAIIKEGIDQGIFEDVDPMLAATIFWSAFVGILQFQENRLAVGKKDYRKSTLDKGLDWLLKAIKKA